MEWTAAQQQELHRFLAGFTNPDPQVQATNLHQLDALAQYPHALFSTCAVVCDDASPPTVRLSATTVARQLLRRQTRLSFYLGSGAVGMGTETALQHLIANLLRSSLQPAPLAFRASLQRATMSLIATLLTAAAVDSTLFAATASAWGNLLSHLLHITAQAELSADPSSDAQITARFDVGAQTAALVRELCEASLTASCPLREWVGGQQQQTTALCTLFSQQLQLLRSALSSHFYFDQQDLSRTQALATWMANLLAAFSSCMDSGVLPSTTPDFSDSMHPESDGGPAVHALRTVSAAVVHIHSTIQDFTLSTVLRPLAVWNDGVKTAASTPELQHLLRSTAPFISVAMRYMADTVLMESLDVLNGNFQRAAMPLLATYCKGAASTELVYDGAGASDSVHAAVVACVSYTAQLVHIEHSLDLTPMLTEEPRHGDRTRTTASYVACVHCILISAATLPTSIVEQLDEYTVQEPDSAEEMLVKSASARRRSPCGKPVSRTSESRGLGDVNEEDDKEEDAEEFSTADGLDIQLPDNGTLRQAVAWCTDSLTCNAEWLAALMPLVIATPQLSPSAQLFDVCAMESALFVCNEALGSMLSDLSTTEAVPCEQLAAQLKSVLLLLPASASDASTAVPIPFFLRVQAVCFVGRLGSGLAEAWKGLHEQAGDNGHTAGSRAQWMAHRTHTALSPARGMEGALWTLAQTLHAEVNKYVQVACVQMITSLITAFVRTLEALVRTGGELSTTDASDLEELLDTSNSIDGDDYALTNPVQSQETNTASAQQVALFCRSLRLTPGFPALLQTLQLVSQSFPCFQWSVRQSIYHLYSEALPPLWILSQQHSSELWACGDHTAAAVTQSRVRGVTVESLEVLAAHYMNLLTDIRTSLFEMASLLSCMADVATVMDAAALENVLPWILQVAHHVLNLYAAYLAGDARSADGTRSSNTLDASFDAAVDMTDMCMVSLDLISCVCDGLIDRDALLALQLCPQEQAEAVAIDARVMALAVALLNPVASTNSSSSSEPSLIIETALPNRCVALLALCQSRLDHPSHAALAVSATTSEQKEAAVRASDEFGEVRRACFAILYDCIFLLAYAESLYRPSAAPSNSTASGCGLSDGLGKHFFALCLQEVTPRGAAVEGMSEGSVGAEKLKAVSTPNAAASDAWLCLGALLSLWDQQSWWARKKHLLNPEAFLGDQHATECICASRPASLLSSALDSTSLPWKQYIQHIFESLLTLLADRRFEEASYLRLNMTSALCGLATVLASGASFSADAGLPQHQLSHHHLEALLGVVSSIRIRDYASDAASGEVKGVGEAGQILWCLGRVWQDAVQPLPRDALWTLLCAKGQDMAKTAVWLLRCITAHTKSLPQPMCPFWASLMELWRPIALTLTQIAQADVISLTLAQSSALHQLMQL